MTSKEMSDKQLLINLVVARNESDMAYKKLKELEEEAKTRVNNYLEKAGEGKE